MIAYQEVGALFLLILGLAFLLVWQGERQNQSAAYWGVAHLSLSLATFTGYRFQDHSLPVFGLVSLICTGIFLMSIYAGNRSLAGGRTRVQDIVLGAVLVTALVGVVGFGIDQIAGKIMVLSLMILLFAWSGWYFWSRLAMKTVSAAFMFRVVSLSTMFTQGPELASPGQDAWVNMINWFSALLLAFTLIWVAVRQSGLRIEQLLRHLPDAVVARRLDGTVLFCNQRFAQLAGAKSWAPLVGKPVPLLAVESNNANHILKEINSGARLGPMAEPVIIERLVRSASGQEFTAEIIYSNDIEFGMTVVVAQVRDISERKRAEAERIRLLSTDPLTGLLNRQGLDFEFEALWRRPDAKGTRFAVMVIDIHRFKRLNDALGVERGDEFLRSVSQTLRVLQRAGTLISRTGGDEFVVVMDNLHSAKVESDLEHIAKALLQSIRRDERIGDLTVLVQANIGVAVSDAEQIDRNTLMKHALLALQQAKSDGAGEFHFYESSMDASSLQAIRLESALREALSNNELSLHYQPIVDAQTGKLVKLEALIRWNSATLGHVSPAVFIPLAEQSQLIIDLGRWILDTACKQAADWARRMASPPIIGVNISVRQFGHQGFEQELLETAARHGVNPGALDLELTESLFVDHNDDGIQSLLQRLANAGFGLSLDDFGTGYSSLSYLTRFPLKTVKVDRSFVSGMDTDSRQRSIVRAIVSMSHNLGLNVVAEGVETEAERRCLVEDGCDLLQGFLIARPASAAQVFMT